MAAVAASLETGSDWRRLRGTEPGGNTGTRSTPQAAAGSPREREARTGVAAPGPPGFAPEQPAGRAARTPPPTHTAVCPAIGRRPEETVKRSFTRVHMPLECGARTAGTVEIG